MILMNKDNEILKYLEQAEQGDYYAMLKVADSYFHKYDDEKNLEKALHWYIRAAESNHPIIKADAMAQIGLMYYNGIGTPVDYDAAFKWLNGATCSTLKRRCAGQRRTDKPKSGMKE